MSDEQIIQALMDERNRSDNPKIVLLSKYIADGLQEVKSIQASRRIVEADRGRLRSGYEESLQRNAAEMAMLRSKCRHLATFYTPDPSGNNDSSTTCLSCGKEL
jgi:hypothetical protein